MKGIRKLLYIQLEKKTIDAQTEKRAPRTTSKT